MGGKGSGATVEAHAKRKYEGSAKKSQTDATQKFYADLTMQAGDCLFEVWRCYPSGKKACVGTTENIRTDQLAIQFGGGEYELVQLRRNDMLPTGKPPLRKTLHPGKYPTLPEFEMDPAEAELFQTRERRISNSAGNDQGSNFAGLSNEQIYEKARADAVKEMQQQNKLDNLSAQVAQLTALMQNPGGAGNKESNISMLRDLLALSKELTPSAMPNNNLVASNPADVLRQSVEAIKLFQTEMNSLPGGNPMMNAIKSATDGPSNVSVLAQTLTTLATAALPYIIGSLKDGGATPQPAAAGAPAAPAVAVAPAPAPAAAGVALSQSQVDVMMEELKNKLAADQALQLQDPPQGHIAQTVEWLKSKWSAPGADPAWTNLKMAACTYPEAQVVDFMAGQMPSLADSEKKKAWLSSLVELARKA